MTRRLPLLPTIIVAAAIMTLIGLGFWQLQRAGEKQALLARYAQAEKLPPITWPTVPLDMEQLPLFRHATGVCLRPVGKRAIAGENAAGETGYAHIVECVTGAEGPGMSVVVGWSRDPNAKVNWNGGPVNGIIFPHCPTHTARGAGPGPPGPGASRGPGVRSPQPIPPAGHRGYAATWFGPAVVALTIYALALRKR